jgi:aminoglycoside phosphotransferase (APT) family kinase protein
VKRPSDAHVAPVEAAAMDRAHELLADVRIYLERRSWHDVPVMKGRRFVVRPLAQGEYNVNYMLACGGLKLVLRVNLGTQIDRADQVQYEFKTLELLQASGVTPRPHFVDDTRRLFDRGVLIMEFLPGEPLDYRRDLPAAAALFARIHQLAVPAEKNHLIRENAPLSMIHAECAGLLESFFEFERGDPGIRAYLRELIAWAQAERLRERYYQADPWPCVVNSEVNSGNFIVNRPRATIHLVDWEMPRWGDPSQDLAHFCSPLTTLWKSDYRMSPPEKRLFMQRYAEAISDRHLRDTLAERVRLREPFVYLRGISWSAMGWVAYQTGRASIRNPDTWAKLQAYLNLAFIRSLFDPFMKQKTPA